MCLGEMAVLGEPTDFTQYTTEWLDIINRGGLFPLNDESFRFFYTVEGIVRTVLPRVVIGTSEDLTRKTVVDAVKQDENVLFWFPRT